MQPDITIYNATTMYPVILAHTRNGRDLMARHYGMALDEIEWLCIERTSTTGNLGFRELHGKIIAAHIVVRNDQASAARLDELTDGGYSAHLPNPRVT